MGVSKPSSSRSRRHDDNTFNRHGIDVRQMYIETTLNSILEAFPESSEPIEKSLSDMEQYMEFGDFIGEHAESLDIPLPLRTALTVRWNRLEKTQREQYETMVRAWFKENKPEPSAEYLEAEYLEKRFKRMGM